MKKLFIATAIVLLAAILILSILLYRNTPKTAYILTEELYNNFKLKKDLEVQYLKVTNLRKAILDSLKFNLQLMYNDLKSGKSSVNQKQFEQIRDIYLEKEKQFGEDNDRLSQQYKDQIWKRLNQYVREYGKGKAFTYIYGVIGEGNLMYAEESKNITKELMAFVNAKYEGD